MADLYIVVEGYGEQGFLRKCVAQHLGTRGVYAHAALVGKPGHKGGVRPWPAVRKDIMNFLKMNRNDRPIHVSMMFDYYGMPLTWPGRSGASEKPTTERSLYIEKQLASDIASCMGDGFISDRFIPYVQMHELEALVLAKPDNLTAEFLNQDEAIEELKINIAGMPPEEINDGPTTAPSKRIISYIPEYGKRKAQATANILYLTGLRDLRELCPHFNEWLTKLENLVP